MNAVSVVRDLFPKRVHTKIAGVTFEGRQQLLAECRRQGVTELRLVCDPRNPYDSYAVAVEADLATSSGSVTTVRLGFLSNSDRVCSDCGTVVGAGLFSRSKTLMCGECGFAFGFSDPAISMRAGGTTILQCPKCDEPVDMDLAKLVICPGCGGSDFGRCGLGTQFSRAIASGLRYRVRVVEYTGGDDGRSLGVNVMVQRIEN